MFKKFAHVLAPYSTDCGPASLATIALHYGATLNVYALAERLGTDLQGTEFRDLQRVAEDLGFETAFGLVKEDCLDKIPLPAIVHFKDGSRGHIVVVHLVSEKHVTIADPAVGLDKLKRDQFMSRWSGRALLLRPVRQLEGEGRSENLRRLVRVLLKHRALLAMAILVALIVTGIAFGVARFTQFVVDSSLQGKAEISFLRVTLLICLLILIRSCLTVAREEIINRVGYLLEFDLSDTFASQLLSLPTKFFEIRAVGDIYSCVNDAAVVRATSLGVIFSAALDLILLAAGTLALSAQNLSLSILIWLVLPLIISVGLVGSGPLSTLDRKMREAASRHASFFLEMSMNAKVLKMYGAESKALGSVRRSLIDLLEIKRERYLTFARMNGVIGFTSAIILVTVLVRGHSLVLASQLSVGKLMLFYTLIAMMVSSAERLAPSLGSLNEALIGIERLHTVNLLTPESTGAISRSDDYFQGGLILLEKVSFSWRSSDPVLRDISLTIREGESVAIVGETGSGKSTLASLMAGLHDPVLGKIAFGGFEISEWDRPSLRKQIAFVFQDAGIIPGSILDNILMGDPSASKDSIDEVLRLACIEAFIEHNSRGLDYQVGHGGVALSSGQRQRIAIARALLRDPALLILDEATGNLDVETEEMVLNNILRSRKGKTTIMITHKLAITEKLDRVIVMRNGQIVEEGSFRALCSMSGHFRRLWETHSI
ncbi:peptidase domain-containing ABC transporter [Granulicella sp. S190]|uniref:peptidase domain-containing ABC transporter n=1 Tax=Granulicella sp. S190 TaxID=1747226 RepID=UPI00131A700B|nr:peptidase domain-containing ABC transporter [Granulicella sp. S190]